MNKIEVLNSICLVPAILEKLNGVKNKNIDLILEKYNVDAEDFRDLKSFLKYHKHVITTNFNPAYPLLREGLTEYFEKYFKDFWTTLGITGTNDLLLDYGCGDGAYSDQFLEVNPDGMVKKVDKQYDIDFEAHPLWYTPYLDTFDVVLLSEILHCKGLKWQDYLIESSLECLKAGGKLIINENIDPFMGWRLNRLTPEGDMMSESDILDLTREYHELDLIDIKTINYYRIYVYEKL